MPGAPAAQDAQEAPAAPEAQDAPDAPTGGAQPNPKGSGGSARACTLLTAEEVSSALGAQVGDGSKPAGSDPLGRRDLCQWQSKKGSNLVLIILPGNLSLTEYMSSFNDSKRVDGVGDEAYYAPSVGKFAMKAGGAVIELMVVGVPEGKKLDFFTDVAGKAAARA